MLDAAVAKTPIEGLAAAQRPYTELAVTYALAGRPANVKQLASSFERSRRTVTMFRDTVDRSVLRAAQAYAEGKYGDAARLFQAADIGQCVVCAWPMIARSFDMAGQRDSALAAYNQYFTVHGVGRIWTDQTYLADSHERAGALYEAKGDVVNAVAHYQQFVDLWKNADPELQPRVTQVRARIARLKDTERR
jgi:hypothetical protein